MQPTRRLLGASRLPLTTKRGNKDYYKGTRQAYVPGESRRTGPPGRQHPYHGKKYQLLDEQVRFFVSPGAETLRNTELKPYVYAGDDPTPLQRHEAQLTLQKAGLPPAPTLPSFQPRARDYVAGRNKGQAFERWYAGLRDSERTAVLMDARRRWWMGMMGRFGQGRAEARAEVEGDESERVGTLDQP